MLHLLTITALTKKKKKPNEITKTGPTTNVFIRVNE